MSECAFKDHATSTFPQPIDHKLKSQSKPEKQLQSSNASDEKPSMILDIFNNLSIT